MDGGSGASIALQDTMNEQISDVGIEGESALV